MEPDLSEFEEFKIIRLLILDLKTAKLLSQLRDAPIELILPIESYTFRGNGSVYWFNITFVEGRIIITGDAGDNVFIVGVSNEDLKNWLINLDMDYALGKSRQGRKYYDKDRVEKYIKDKLLDEAAHTEDEAKAIMDQLDFSSHVLLQNSMCSTNELCKIFPDYWELNLFDWSPMQKIQYKQLVVAGKMIKEMENGSND